MTLHWQGLKYHSPITCHPTNPILNPLFNKIVLLSSLITLSKTCCFNANPILNPYFLHFDYRSIYSNPIFSLSIPNQILLSCSFKSTHNYNLILFYPSNNDTPCEICFHCIPSLNEVKSEKSDPVHHILDNTLV